MKLGICSDSHDNLPNLRRAMLEFKRRGAGAVIHAGDFVAPFTIDVLKLAGCPVYAVFGNCDGERTGLENRFGEIGEIHTEPYFYTLGGLRVALMHCPRWLEIFARPEIADLVIYGHLHELHIEHRPPWVINPGEVFGCLSSGPTAVWFDSEAGEPEIIRLDKLPDEPVNLSEKGA